MTCKIRIHREPTYLEVGDAIVKFKHKKSTRGKWNNVKDFKESWSTCLEVDARFN